ncbi:MAG: hypothetical protein HYY52_03835 [Candidatus Melainabacteria bacterium]|nr:hypothetical protein [Candidatus Melainabacteria bacterium]
MSDFTLGLRFIKEYITNGFSYADAVVNAKKNQDMVDGTKLPDAKYEAVRAQMKKGTFASKTAETVIKPVYKGAGSSDEEVKQHSDNFGRIIDGRAFKGDINEGSKKK